MFDLSLFSSVSLSGPSGALEGRVTQRRPLALLSLLAASQNAQSSRDKLVAYLWRDSGSKTARHRLSVTLHAIRKALGKESVLSTGDDLRLNFDVVVVDVREFHVALEAGEAERAVELYTGPFMDGFYLDDAPEFERWQEGERARLSRRYAGALETLAEEAEAEGDVRGALEWWRKLAAHDPHSSRVALRLMRTLEIAGDRPEALRVARVHGSLVREELGLEPDPEVLGFAERLENGEVERLDGAGPTVGAPEPSPASSASVSSEGAAERSRTSRRSKLALRSGLVAATTALALLIAAVAFLASNGDAPDYDSRSVLVDLFANRTEDPELRELGRMATNWITQGLSYTGFVDVVTLGTPLLTKTPELDPSEVSDRRDRLERIAREHGTGTLIWGDVYRRADSLYFGAHVTDARDHRELASLEPVAASVQSPLPALEQLRDQVMTALATRTDPRLEKWQRNASKPPTFEAYQKFVEGLELHTTHHRMGEAADRFREAAALDTGFTMAKLWEAMALANARRWEEARPILHALDERRERLAPLDQAFLDYLRAREDGDDMGRLRAARRMVEIAPGSEYLKLAGHAALEAYRPEESVRHYERADPESGWLRGWESYWPRLAEAHHRLGNYERQLEVARRGRSLYPDNMSIRSHEVRALAASRRTEELEAAIAASAGLDPGSEGWLLASAGEELVKHGHEDAGREFYGRAIQWHRARVAGSSDPELFDRLTLLRLLRRTGDLAGANEQLEILMSENPDDPRVLRAAGLLRAAEGKREAAMEFLRRFEELDEMWWIGFEPEIAALLDDREWTMRVLRRYEESPGVHRPYYRHAPEFRSLWDHPPFQELMRPEG